MEIQAAQATTKTKKKMLKEKGFQQKVRNRGKRRCKPIEETQASNAPKRTAHTHALRLTGLQVVSVC